MHQKGQSSAIVTSNSMAPLLRRDDLIILVKTQPNKLKAGDLVVLHTEQELIVHRYWDSRHLDDKPYLITKGDRLAVFDPLMPASYLVGRVIKRVRKNRVTSFNKSPGQLVNKVLSFMLLFETKLVGPPLPSEGNNQAYLLDPAIMSNEFESFQRRSIHRLLYVAARALVGCLELFGKKTEADHDFNP